MTRGLVCFGMVVAALAMGDSAAMAQAKIPSVLIVQAYSPSINDLDPNLPLDSYFAGELEQEGRVVPIVWSLSDPVFRGLVEDGELPRFTATPSEKEIREVAARLKVDYVLTIAAIKEEGQAKPIANLYRGTSNKEIWSFGRVERDRAYRPVVIIDGKRDDAKSKELMDRHGAGHLSQTMVVTINGLPDWESTSRSIARTWRELLAATAWSGHPPHPKVANPADTNTTVQPRGVTIQASADNSVLERADALIAEGRPDMAILVLRDSIDLAPFEPKRRVKLATLLMDQGLPEEAALEARRAAQLTPEHIELWLMAAKGWLLAQKPDEAQADVNQALSRNANRVATHEILGDIYVLQGKYTEAIASYTASIEAGPKVTAVIGRAIAYAMASMPAECAEDLARLKDTSPESLSAAYAVAIQLADQGLDSLANELRNLIPAIRLAPKSAEVIARAEKAQRAAHSLANLISALPVPARHVKSHEGRDLAHKLLAQSAQETLDFAQTGDADLGSEAAISLGEALKLLPNIREAYRIERRDQDSSIKP